MSRHHENVSWQRPGGLWCRGFYRIVEFCEDEWEQVFSDDEFEELYADYTTLEELEAAQATQRGNPGSSLVVDDREVIARLERIASKLVEATRVHRRRVNAGVRWALPGV